MNRWADWWAQAERDLAHAKSSVPTRDYEWAAFAAQQAAEKATKALVLTLGGEPWGHSIAALIESLREAAGESATAAALRLDRHYLPTRYPNGFPAGFPGKYYTQREAEEAIRDAETIIEFCRSRLPRS